MLISLYDKMVLFFLYQALCKKKTDEIPPSVLLRIAWPAHSRCAKTPGVFLGEETEEGTCVHHSTVNIYLYTEPVSPGGSEDWIKKEG